MAETDQVLDRGAGANEVIDRDREGVHHGHPLDLNDRNSGGERESDIVLVNRGCEQDSVHPAAEQRLDAEPLARRVAMSVEHQDATAVAEGFLLDTQRNAGEEQVGNDALEEETDGGGALATQALGDRVELVAGRGQCGLDVPPGLGGHTAIGVEHSGDGGRRNTGQIGNILESRASGHGHLQPPQTPIVIDDNGR